MKDGRTDKERILIKIISGMRRGSVRVEGNFLSSHGSLEIKPGELVLCCTNPGHEWGVAFYVGPGRYRDSFLLREIGSNRLLDMSNEAILPIRGLSEEDMLDGDKLKNYRRILAAFDRFEDGDKRNPESADGWKHKFHSASFSPEGDEATVRVRPRNTAIPRDKLDMNPVPYEIRLDLKGRISVVGIQRQMLKQGYGNREWEYVKGKAPGTFRKEDVASMLSQDPLGVEGLFRK